MGRGAARVEVLGAVRIVGDDGTAVSTGATALSVLSVLTMRLGRGATLDEILDAVWPDPADRPSRSNVRLHLSRLRRMLTPEGEADPLPRHNDRYRIDTAVVAVDVVELEHALDGSRGDEHPADVLERAVRLWRGTPYDGLDDLAGLHEERRRLERER